MAAQRKIEIFSAGCAVCEQAIDQVRDAACPSCDIVILDMRDASVAKRAESLGIRSVPAVVIDGALA
ncbi:MAG: thioredoxin family protein, partial [Geminicoccales bacterium]